MNKTRRKEIQKIIKDIENLVHSILSEEQVAFDNMPENLQGSWRGTESEDAQGSLESAIDALEEAIACLDEII